MSTTKYVIPMGAAVPSELEQVPLLSGSLAERMQAYYDAPSCILPLGDVEMNALAKVSEVFPLHPGVAIQGLPGAFSSAIFDAAVASAGLEVQQWDTIKAALGEAKREAQRSQDKSPWTVRAPRVDETLVAVNAPVADDDAEA